MNDTTLSEARAARLPKVAGHTYGQAPWDDEKLPYLTFQRTSPEMVQLHRWWQELNELVGRNDRYTPANNRTRSELRRAATIADVILNPGFQQLVQWLEKQLGRIRESQLETLAAIVGLLAHIRTDYPQSGSLPTLMHNESGAALVSEVRFRRLLKSSDLEQLFGQLRRILPLMGQRANVRQLGAEVAYWFVDQYGTPRRWAYDYRWD